MNVKDSTISQQEGNINISVSSLVQNFLSALKILFNPSHILYDNNFGEKNTKTESRGNYQDKDLRSPNALKLGGWKTIHSLRVLIIAWLDASAIALAWILAQSLNISAQEFNSLWTNNEILNWLIIVITVHIGIFFAAKLYGTDRQSRSFISLIKAISLAHAITFLLASLSIYSWLASPEILLLAWSLTLILIVGERYLLNLGIEAIRKNVVYLRRKVLLLGNKEDIIEAKKLLEHNGNFKIVETADLSVCQDSSKWTQTLYRVCLQKVDEVFVCSWENIENPIALFWQLQSSGINWRVLPVSLKIPIQWSEIGMIGMVEEVPTFRFHSNTIVGADYWWKRIFDLVTASCLLAVLSLPMLLIALCIKLDSPGSVFYKQTRVGLGGQHFQIWKFRTMVANASQLQQELETKNEVQGGVLFKIKDDPRITRVGKLLRKYSLDELPQLFNVLRGEMSLVGPRPLPIRDVARFSSTSHLIRHEVLPGITGLWQVSGRSDTDSEQIFSWDFAYIQNWSLALDVKILLKTVVVVLTKKGAY